MPGSTRYRVLPTHDSQTHPITQPGLDARLFSLGAVAPIAVTNLVVRISRLRPPVQKQAYSKKTALSVGNNPMMIIFLLDGMSVRYGVKPL